MTELRDKIAIAAMQGLIQYMGCDPEDLLYPKREQKNKHALSKSAYAYADAMLEERNKLEGAPNPYLKMCVFNIPFTSRVWNCFKAENIVTLGDLVQRTEREIRLIPNLGLFSLKEIQDELAIRGLALKEEG